MFGLFKTPTFVGERLGELRRSRGAWRGTPGLGGAAPMYTTIDFVQVSPLDGHLTVEIACRVAWDDEHTLGARLRDGQLIGLNGSVLAPSVAR
jgi:hypothetical protein